VEKDVSVGGSLCANVKHETNPAATREAQQDGARNAVNKRPHKGKNRFARIQVCVILEIKVVQLK
jgi:hypothetical protein